LYCAWYHCSHLCCYPWKVLLVLKSEYFLCLLICKVWVPFICLQPEVQIWASAAVTIMWPYKNISHIQV
jgi:hypothetical protein